MAFDKGVGTVKEKHVFSLRRQIGGIILLCWLIPVLMLLGVMGQYLADSVGQRAERSLSGQLQVNLRMCADRLDSAAQSSRLASYDPAIRSAWSAYRAGGRYADLYRETRSFLNRQYGSDSRFQYAVFWFTEDPERMMLTTLTGFSGAVYGDITRSWAEDFPAASAMAGALDTSIGFLERDGRCYLVRNLMDSSYQPIGVLVLSLNLPYYFDNLTALPWAQSVSVTLNDTALALKGEAPAGGADRVLEEQVDGAGYRLSAAAAIDYGVLLSQVSGYRALLIAMLLLLVPLLIFTFFFLRRKVSGPIEALMDGAREIEEGQLGHQLAYRANSREFQYLTDSFNHMSGQLQSQFDRLYQEELALRDARIKALQSHINPHFLNNTLEIINWEARMSGDAKVSKMIEALSTVLDAALDRQKKPQVRLAEELTYVKAYLYIVSERFGKRLNVSIDLPEALMDCMVPRLILQPVIENAVEHGFGPGGSGSVTLTGRLEGETLILEVGNDGGLSPEDEAHIAHLLSPGCDPSRESSGNIGISNVNQRLRILCGAESGLSIRRGEGGRVVATLAIAQRPRA